MLPEKFLLVVPSWLICLDVTRVLASMSVTNTKVSTKTNLGIILDSVSTKTYIDEPWSSGGWGELKDSPRIIVLHDDNLSAGEASFQDLIVNITPGIHTYIKNIRS